MSIATTNSVMEPPPEREQTLLRVKRRRNEAPASTIRLELLGGWNVRRQNKDDDDDDGGGGGLEYNKSVMNALNSETNGSFPSPPSLASGLGNSQHSSTSTTSTTQVHNLRQGGESRAAAVWKRVEQLEGDHYYDFAAASGKKRCRVVEAILEGDGLSTKRRKLTFLGESKGTQQQGEKQKSISNKKNKIYRVLDPLTRLVDDSLTMVHSGDRTVAQHYTFVTTDPRLAPQARTWLAYKNRGGNLLHACAHWNDVELAHDLLRQNLPLLAESVDSDGRTPYETAEMCGHPSICEVLEAFGADTTNYVYDMFMLEEPPHQNNNNKMDTTMQENGAEESWNPLDKTTISRNTDVTTIPVPPNITAAQHAHDLALLDASRLLELQGGVGYWTEDGELILEVDPNHMMGIATEYEPDSEGDEDEIDSNCEDYGGNDYPEDESWEEEFLHEEQLAEDDSTGGPAADDYNLW